MKIADLKKNINESIYKQILETNEIDKNCTLLREAIAVRGQHRASHMSVM